MHASDAVLPMQYSLTGKLYGKLDEKKMLPFAIEEKPYAWEVVKMHP